MTKTRRFEPVHVGGKRRFRLFDAVDADNLIEIIGETGVAKQCLKHLVRPVREDDGLHVMQLFEDRLDLFIRGEVRIRCNQTLFDVLR